MTQVEKMLEEYEALKNRAHNLNLYLDYVRQTQPLMWSALMDTFSGMPGFTEHEDGYQAGEQDEVC